MDEPQGNPFASPLTDEAPALGRGPGWDYVSAAGRAKATLVSFWTLIGLYAAASIAGIHLITTIRTPPSQNAIDVATGVFVVCAVASVVAYIATVVLFCRWKYRSYKNLWALGEEGARFSPGWAVGYYFVPVMNLFQPYRAMKDLWNGSSGQPVENRALLVAAWWAMFLLLGFVEWAMLFVDEETDPLLEMQSLAVTTMIETIFAIPAALLAILVVRGVQKRQDAAAKRLGLV